MPSVASVVLILLLLILAIAAFRRAVITGVPQTASERRQQRTKLRDGLLGTLAVGIVIYIASVVLAYAEGGPVGPLGLAGLAAAVLVSVGLIGGLLYLVQVLRERQRGRR